MNLLLLDDCTIEYWAEIFIQKNYVRYMTFEEFLAGPEINMQLMERGDFGGNLPLLAKQRKVYEEILVAELAGNICLRGQHLIEPLKHHFYRH